ncbi:MAG TPA: PIG-L deacetylase family protein [Acidimicrobiia bacterium]|nr:PIG-L deacetylase family protein [Acidimicrobiia bacterium]
MTNLYDDARPTGDEEATFSRLPVPASAMTVAAHPDDAEFGAGGTLARWAAVGCEVTIVVLTDGSKGTWDESLTTAELIDARQREQARAAEILGVARVFHLEHVDGELVNSMALREEICRLIRTVRPQVVLGHDPWRRYMLHPDHRAAGWGLIDGVVAARDHLFFPDQGLDKHRPEAMLLWQADETDHFEDISSTFDQKIRALLCHSSQTTTTMGDANRSDVARRAFRERMQQLAARLGEPANLPAAEAFKLIRP